MKWCTVCGDVKRTVCRKKACVDATRPLLLMPPQQAEPILATLVATE